MKAPIGVLLMGYGGPDSTESVGPFMEKLTGHVPPPPVLEAIKSKYLAIGGKSPLLENMEKQAAALSKVLGAGYSVKVGMRFWKPFIADAMASFEEAGIGRMVGFPMSPFSSAHSDESYFKAVRSYLEQSESGMEVRYSGNWSGEPKFIEAVRFQLRKALSQSEGEPMVVFTAHSLPISPGSDSYAEEVKKAAREVMSAPGLERHWTVAFQSKGRRGEQWLTPLLDDFIETTTAESLLLVPLGFTSEHVETLFDLDIEAKEEARKRGISITRAEALNDHPLFIKMIADKITEITAKGEMQG